MNDELQNQIERYLLREMAEEEERNFTARVNSDDSLKREVELTALIIGATKKVGEKSDLSEIEALKNVTSADIERLTRRKKNISAPKIIYWAVSSAAVILLAVVLNHSYQQNRQATRLFAAYYQPFEDDLGTHRGSSDISAADADLLAKGLEFYNEKKYAEALGLFNQVSEKNQPSVVVYQAVCLLETDKAKQAAELLQTAISENGEGWEYYQDAEWYLALAYIKAKQMKEAKVVFKQIVDNGRVYAEKAGEFLQRL